MGTIHHPVCDVVPRGRTIRSEDCAPGAHVLPHDFSRRRWVGLPDGESCYFSLLEGAGPVTVVAAVIVWLHCTRGGVLLDEGWVHFG